MKLLAAAVIALPRLSYSLSLPSSREASSIESELVWNLCSDDGSPLMFSSNLGGHGPDTGAREFRIKELVGVNGVKLDLVVTVAEGATYKSYLQEHKKGPGGAYVSPCRRTKCKGERAEPMGPPCFGVIPFQVKTQTKFKWKFVESGTSAVHVVSKFGLKIIELDRERDDWDGQGADNEFVDFNTLPSEITHGSGLKKVQLQDGVWRVESLETGGLVDNPAVSGPPLTAKQERNSAHVIYTNTGEWEMTFGHFNGNSRFDRSIYFSGSFYGTPTPPPTPAPTPAPTPSPPPPPPQCEWPAGWECDGQCQCWPRSERGDFDCDRDSDCTSECHCGNANCGWSSWGSRDDCCICPTYGQCGQPDHYHCNAQCSACWPKSQTGSFDCDWNSDCPSGMKCANANCAWSSGIFKTQDDCCVMAR